MYDRIVQKTPVAVIYLITGYPFLVGLLSLVYGWFLHANGIILARKVRPYNNPFII